MAISVSVPINGDTRATGGQFRLSTVANRAMRVSGTRTGWKGELTDDALADNPQDILRPNPLTTQSFGLVSNSVVTAVSGESCAQFG